MPINADMGESGGIQARDSWDIFRAKDWDNLARNVPELLNILGVQGRSGQEQREALRAFTQTAPYVPCPFKPQVEAFLEEGG